MQRYLIEISWGTLWKIFFFAAMVALLVSSLQIFLGLFLAVIISAGLEFIVDFLERRGVPRSIGVVFLFLVCAFLVTLLAYTLVPLLIIDLNTVLLTFNKSAASYWLGPLVNFNFDKSVQVIVSRLSGQLFSGNISPFATVSDVVGGFGLAIAVIVSSFYLTLSRDGVGRFIRAVLPSAYEEPVLRVYHRSRHKLAYWFRTQIILSVLVGGLTWLALWLIGVKHALLLAILAAIFELVPFIGPVLSGAAAVLSALTISPVLALYTLIAFLIIHQIESHVLVPVLTRRSVGLHPVIVITSLLIGIEVGGFLGAIIAVPAAAVAQEILEGWTKTRKTAA